MSTNDIFPLSSEASTLFALQVLILLLNSISLFILQELRNTHSAEKSTKGFPFFSFALGIQFFLTVILLFAHINGLFSEEILTIIFQFFIILSTSALIWVWCFPISKSKIDLIFLIYSLIVCALFFLEIIFTFLIQIKIINVPSFFGHSQLLFALLFFLSGIIVLIAKRPDNWFAGILFSIFSIMGIYGALSNPGSDQTQMRFSLIFFEAFSFTFLPLLPLSLIRKQELDQKITTLPTKEIFISWLKLVEHVEKNLLAQDLMISLENIFSAEKTTLFVSSQTGENQYFIFAENKESRIGKQNHEKGQIFSFVEPWIWKNKPLILPKNSTFSKSQLSFLKSVGYDQPVNILFYPLSSSNKKDVAYSLFLFSNKITWEQKHLDLLSEVKYEIIRVLKKISFRTSIDDGQEMQDRTKPQDSELLYSKNYSVSTSDADKIQRLESELKLTLEEYDRLHKLLEDNIRKTSSNRK